MDKLQEILESGGAVILPTETVYGLFAKALNEDAVNHVYDLKMRPRDKAMNLNVADLESILAFSKNQPDYLNRLYEKFLPGPLTIILEANERVPAWINSGLSTIGFRLPKHPVTLDLIKKAGPLIGPSANLSGTESGKIFSKVKEQFSEEIVGFEDDLALTGQDSTILDLTGEKARILRQGSITKEELLQVIPELRF
ncbi:L-threonylcarbamoyladenylate synthase [Streptococcus henryi]|uniref:L-threonylcarbamoyladenylate synthase n=1 Tax=Streptococcus henryi TaxID=439219 RepID=A0A1G6DN73_9STRE|nr:L-threonylcarbamoyladenylate synthase [Streptococcus henryi]SDB46578.1 L-threonylcarbamoyladenylate synthase [Streptococcus henryi]